MLTPHTQTQQLVDRHKSVSDTEIPIIRLKDSTPIPVKSASTPPWSKQIQFKFSAQIMQVWRIS